MDERAVVTCFLRNRGEILLLCRSEAVGSYAGRWSGVAGHVETAAGEDRPPATAARAEIREETGIDPDAITLVRTGDPFTVEDADLGIRWRVHPFLWDCPTRSVEADWETDEWAWVAPPEILRRETVPALWTSYDRVRPRVATVREDRAHGSAWLSLAALRVLRDEAALAVEGGSEATAEQEAAGDDWPALAALAETLLDARPSMAVVTNRVNRAMARAGESETPAAVEKAAHEGINRAATADEDAAATAAEQLPARVATLSRSGTVLTALREREPEAVLVAESRPGGEGVGVAETLAESLSGTDVRLTTDAALPGALASGDAEALVVGADRLLPDGRVVNKVGTHGAAVAAAAAEVPCYVVAASDKVATDERVDREERPATELYDGDAPITVANPTFEVTPADAVTAVCTERGVVAEGDIEALVTEHRRLAAWND